MDLTALLCIGFAVLVSGTAISARIGNMIYHTALRSSRKISVYTR